MAVVSTLISLAITAAVNIGISMIQKALTKKPKANVEAIDAGQMVQRSLGYKEPLSVVVGKRNSGGVGYYDDGHGNKNENGISITVHSSKPVTSHTGLFLKTERATLSGDPTQGEVEVTNIFLGKNNARRVKYRFFTGANNSGLGTYLRAITGGRFSAADRFGNSAVSVLICRNTNDDLDESSGKSFIPFQGYPSAVVEVEGVKVCDPRIAGASYDDESTYVFSSNAALIEAQYDYGFYDGEGANRFKVVGNGYPVELLDLDQIKANADYCDLRGYECHGRLRSGRTDDQEEIRKCYNATRYEVSGKVYSLPEGNRPRYGDLDLDELPAAFISFYDGDGDATDVYNQMQTYYVEPQEFYSDKELPQFTDTALLDADGGIPRETELPLNFVTSPDQAARLQKEEMAVLRATESVSIENLPLWCDAIPLGHIITLRNARMARLNDRDWVVEGKEENEQGDIRLSLREHFDNQATVNPPSPDVPVNIAPIRVWPWYEPEDNVSQDQVDAASNSLVPIGTNALVDSDFIHGTRFWQDNLWPGTAVGDVHVGINHPGFHGARNVLWGHATGVQNAGNQIEIGAGDAGGGLHNRHRLLSVKPGDHVGAFAEAAHHRGETCHVNVHWYNADGQYYGQESVAGSGGQGFSGAGGLPENFERIGGIVVAPAGAAFAGLRLRGACNDAEANPYFWFAEPMLAKVPNGQTAWLPYSPSPVDRRADHTPDNIAAGIEGEGRLARQDTVRTNDLEPNTVSDPDQTSFDYALTLTDGVWETVATVGPREIGGVAILKWKALFHYTMFGGVGTEHGTVHWRIMSSDGSIVEEGLFDYTFNTAIMDVEFALNETEFDLITGTRTYMLQVKTTVTSEKTAGPIETRNVAGNLKVLAFKR